MTLPLSDIFWIAVSLVLCTIAIKTAVVAGSVLYDAIGFILGIVFDVIAWFVSPVFSVIALAVSLLFRVLCIAIVVWIAQVVWTNRLDLMERLRFAWYIGMRKFEAVWMKTNGKNPIKITLMPSLNKSQGDMEGLDAEERNARACVVCQDNLRTIVCLPCRHFAMCEECSNRLATGNFASGKACPMCRMPIRELIKVYV